MGEELQQDQIIDKTTQESVVDNVDLSVTQDSIVVESPVVEIQPEVQSSIHDLSLSDLISEIEKYCNKESVESSRSIIEEIRAIFYKKLKIDIEQKRQKFIDEGGAIETFKLDVDLESQFKEIYARIKEIRAELVVKHEQILAENLQKRLQIIEEIKDLSNKEESLDKTFKEFRSLQDKWRQVGQIPQTSIKTVWEKYHHHVGIFYDYVKINNELRDLDLRKNFEAKMQLCEKAEALILEKQIVMAFSKLQKLHDLWREIGPVPDEKKEEIWIRFKNATTQINKAHQDYFASLKDQEKSNLEAKTILCDKVDEIVAKSNHSLKDWNDATEQITNIQKLWKTIGFAPQKQNNQIYDRFCSSCDSFFVAKREFFHSIKADEEINKQKRIDLCVQAEQLKTRSDWKEATNDFFELQKAWKEVGPISHKESTKLWNRFRAACDEFFNAKQKFYQNKDSEQVQNLELKLALIKKIESLQPSDDAHQTLQLLQTYQKEWAEIGFIPVKKKEKVQKDYRDAIQKQFNAINLPQDQKQKVLYKVKVENMMHEAKGSDKIYAETSKLQNRIRIIENDINVLENNIGFFAKSKNAEKLIEDVENKILKGKQEIDAIKQQLRVIRSIKDEK